MLIIRFLFIKAIYIGSIDIPYVQNCLSLILIELLMEYIITEPVSIFPEEQSPISSAVTDLKLQTDGRMNIVLLCIIDVFLLGNVPLCGTSSLFLFTLWPNLVHIQWPITDVYNWIKHGTRPAIFQNQFSSDVTMVE